MITLTAKINVLGSSNTTLNLGSEDISGNNISSNISSIVGYKKNIVNPLIFGVSKLGSGATFESKDSFLSRSGGYYIGNQPSNNNGVFENPYSLVINGVNYSTFNIQFDTINNRHPNYIYIDGQEHLVNNSTFTFIDLNETSSHTILIDNWNTPNAPLVISGIYIEVSIQIDRTNLVDLYYTRYDRADLKLPSFGIISNTGEIEFNDIDGKIKMYAEKLLLQNGLDCEVKINNTLFEGVTQTVCLTKTSQWNYDNDNRKVSVSIQDDLEEWQDINVEGFPYDAKNRPQYTLMEFYEYLQEKTPTKYKMLKFSELDLNTQSILENIKITYPLLQRGSLWEQWTKMCQVAQAHIYKLENGRTTFVYRGGN